MEKDIILVLVAAFVGFISAYTIEVTKNRLEGKRLKQEREKALEAVKEKNIRDFLTNASAENRYLAWIKLVKTPKPALVQQSISASLAIRFTRPANKQKTIELSEEDVKRNINVLRRKKLKVIQKYILLSIPSPTME